MIFGMTISIIMTGMGIVALAGIVVRNGILLVEFTDVLKKQGAKTRNAIIEAGKTRITPVILTATATILGLIPLAIGMNINFSTLLTHLNPQLHFGGDNVMFFGPLSWTIIFGSEFCHFPYSGYDPCDVSDDVYKKYKKTTSQDEQTYTERETSSHK